MRQHSPVQRAGQARGLGARVRRAAAPLSRARLSLEMAQRFPIARRIAHGAQDDHADDDHQQERDDGNRFAEQFRQEPAKVASIVLIGNVLSAVFIPLGLAIALH